MYAFPEFKQHILLQMKFINFVRKCIYNGTNKIYYIKEIFLNKKDKKKINNNTLSILNVLLFICYNLYILSQL